MVRLAVDVTFMSRIRDSGPVAGLDPAALAHRADLAGADTVVARLEPAAGAGGFVAAEVRRIAGIVRGRVSVAVRGTASVEDALALEPAEVLFLGKDAGPVDLRLEGAAADPLVGALEKVRAAGATPVVAVWPDPAAVLAAQDAGAEVVELDAGTFGEARTDDAMAEALRRFSEAARTASGVGLRVRAGGGIPGPGAVARLAEVPEVEEIRVGPALLARAVYDGFEAAVRALRDEIERGARRGDRSYEEQP